MGIVANNIMVIMLTERPVNNEQLMCINISFSFTADKMYVNYLHIFAVSVLTTVDAEICYGCVCVRRCYCKFKYRNKMTVTDGLRQQ